MDDNFLRQKLNYYLFYLIYGHRLNKKDSNLVFVSENCHPQTIDVIQTRAEPMGLKVLVGNEDKVLDQLKEDLVCGILQYPGTLGDIKDPSEAISKIHKKNGKAVLVSDLLALALLKTPRELGADIAVGSSQRFGIPMGYGGPHAAFFATKDEFKRSMPGRIIGVSVDRHGNKALFPCLSTDTPIILPGIDLLNSSLVAKKAA